MKPARAAAIRPRLVKPDHPLQWLAEPLVPEPTFVLKFWFGGRTIMLHGCHQLFLTINRLFYPCFIPIPPCPSP